MTLTELLVAMATLSGMIAGTGYVFTESSRAVASAQVTIRVNANLRATAALLREDIRSLCPDGVLILSGPTSASDDRPQVLMFTATGRYVSATETDPTTGGPVTSNAAMIVYVLAEDAAAGGGGGGVLCRYVYLLSGDRSRPANLRELVEQALANPDDPNPFDGSDVLGDSLGVVLGKAPHVATGDNGPLDKDYLAPLLRPRPPARVNTAPLRMDDDTVGGVAQLWPYVAGGCGEMAFTFADGYAEDGVTPSAATEWFTTASEAAYCRRGGDGKRLRRYRTGSAWIVWRRADRDHRPDAIRVQLTLGGPTGETSARAFEIILPIRR